MQVVTFCGSAGAASANRAALDATGRALAARGVEVADTGAAGAIPMFAPELVDDPPPAVAALRAMANETLAPLGLALLDQTGG